MSIFFFSISYDDVYHSRFHGRRAPGNCESEAEIGSPLKGFKSGTDILRENELYIYEYICEYIFTNMTLFLLIYKYFPGLTKLATTLPA